MQNLGTNVNTPATSLTPSTDRRWSRVQNCLATLEKFMQCSSATLIADSCGSHFWTRFVIKSSARTTLPEKKIVINFCCASLSDLRPIAVGGCNATCANHTQFLVQQLFLLMATKSGNAICSSKRKMLSLLMPIGPATISYNLK